MEPDPSGQPAPPQTPGEPNDIGMVVSYKGGQPFPTSTSDYVDALNKKGTPAALSKDGSRVTMDLPGPPAPDGTQPSKTLHIRSLIEANGGTVHSMTPQNLVPDPDNSNVSTWLTGLNSTLSTDGEKQRNVTNHMQSAGDKDPAIVGAGNDWYHYNPSAGGWTQVAKTTNGSAMLGKALGMGPMLGEGLGMAGGAATGALAGAPEGILPAIPGAMLGGAAGGAGGAVVGEDLTKSALGAIDSDYRHAVSGSEEMGRLGTAAVHGGEVGAIGGGLGMVIPPIANAASGVLGSVGEAANVVGKALGSEFGSEAAADMLPVAGNVKMAADLPQFAQGAVRKTPGLLGSIAESAPIKAIAKFFGSEEGLQGFADNARELAAQSGSAGDLGQAADTMMRQNALKKMEIDALGSGNASLIHPAQNQALSTSNNAAEVFGKGAGLSEEDIASVKNELAQKLTGASPVSEEDAWRGMIEGRQMPTETPQLSLDDPSQYSKTMTWPGMGRGPMEAAGDALDTGADVGAQISRPIKGAVQGTGKGLSAVGQLGQLLGDTTVPAAAGVARYYGIPEAGERVRQYIIDQLRSKNGWLNQAPR